LHFLQRCFVPCVDLSKLLGVPILTPKSHVDPFVLFVLHSLCGFRVGIASSCKPFVDLLHRRTGPRLNSFRIYGFGVLTVAVFISVVTNTLSIWKLSCVSDVTVVDVSVDLGDGELSDLTGAESVL